LVVRYIPCGQVIKACSSRHGLCCGCEQPTWHLQCMPRLPERAAPICQSKHLGLAVKPGWDLCSCLGAEQGRVALLVGGPACVHARVPRVRRADALCCNWLTATHGRCSRRSSSRGGGLGPARSLSAGAASITSTVYFDACDGGSEPASSPGAADITATAYFDTFHEEAPAELPASIGAAALGSGLSHMGGVLPGSQGRGQALTSGGAAWARRAVGQAGRSARVCAQKCPAPCLLQKLQSLCMPAQAALWPVCLGRMCGGCSRRSAMRIMRARARASCTLP